MIYLKLVWNFIQVGLFSVGGGYAAIPLIQSRVVESQAWLTLTEFTDLITIAEMTPGPIAVNSATFVGMRVAGLYGALAATFGCILPSCVLVSLLAVIYRKYKDLSALQSVLACLRAVVVGLIASACLSILKLAVFDGSAIGAGSVNILNAVLFIAAFLALRSKKISPILTMVLCGVIYTAVSVAFGIA